MHSVWSIVSAVTGDAVRTRVRSTSAQPEIYLTFDDGPHAEHTPRLLALLRAHDAKATFFLIGRAVASAPEIVARILAEGHAIGNHSMTHPRMASLNASEQIAEVDRADAVLARFDGRAHHPFRPPHGQATLPTIASSIWRRQPLVLWTTDSLDYRLPAVEVVTRLRADPPAGGDILLFHDDGPCAGEALETLLPEWSALGLRFRSLQ